MRRAALLALVVGGCGSSTATTTVITRVQTVTKTATATTPTRTTRPQTARTRTTSEAPARFVHYGFFRTPSGNIGCALAGGEARCDIRQRSWSPPPRPASCPLDYGQGLVVGRSGPGRYVCAGDTALITSGPVLGYGTASSVGGFVCVSRTTGMTCTNPRTGHGFSLSRQAPRLF